MKKICALTLAGILTVGAPEIHADEGGVPFWFSGQFASLAAVPATPGWSLTTSPYYYNGSAGRGKTFQKGETVYASVDSSAPLLLLQPGYAAKKKIFGGQPYIGIGWGVGVNRTSADLTLSMPPSQFKRSDTTSGGTDLYPYASLSWNKGNDNWMTYLTGDIPVGAYNPNRLANLGIGHAAIDAGGGYTYFNEKTGREFSAVLGATYNFENNDTNIQNGIDSHLDWGASQFLSANWEVGIVGYVYQQVTADSGSGNRLGSFKSRVAAVGPEVGYAFTYRKKAAYFNLRGYYEFWAKNRVEGYAIFGTLVLPL